MTVDGIVYRISYLVRHFVAFMHKTLALWHNNMITWGERCTYMVGWKIKPNHTQITCNVRMTCSQIPRKTHWEGSILLFWIFFSSKLYQEKWFSLNVFTLKGAVTIWNSFSCDKSIGNHNNKIYVHWSYNNTNGKTTNGNSNSDEKKYSSFSNEIVIVCGSALYSIFETELPYLLNVPAHAAL